MVQVQINLDDEELKEALSKHKRYMNRIAKKMMNSVLNEIRKEARNTKLKGQVLQRRTGQLSRSLRYVANNNFTAGMIGEYYLRFHDYGPCAIMPRNPARTKYLIFKINGEWKKVKRVTLPQRQTVRSVIDDYFNRSTKSAEIMERTMQAELDKIYGGL